MLRPIRLSEISLARQVLVRLCQFVNYGSIEDVAIREAEPLSDPVPVIVRNLKLGVDEPPRPELTLADFALNDRIIRMLTTLDAIQSGTIRKMEVTAGIPQRISVESQSVTFNEKEGLAPETKW
jgi:hypothetical protein